MLCPLSVAVTLCFCVSLCVCTAFSVHLRLGLCFFFCFRLWVRRRCHRCPPMLGLGCPAAAFRSCSAIVWRHCRLCRPCPAILWSAISVQMSLFFTTIGCLAANTSCASSFPSLPSSLLHLLLLFHHCRLYVRLLAATVRPQSGHCSNYRCSAASSLSPSLLWSVVPVSNYRCSAASSVWHVRSSLRLSGRFCRLSGCPVPSNCLSFCPFCCPITALAPLLIRFCYRLRRPAIIRRCRVCLVHLQMSLSLSLSVRRRPAPSIVLCLCLHLHRCNCSGHRAVLVRPVLVHSDRFSGSRFGYCPAAMCLCAFRKSIQPLSGGCRSAVATVQPPLHPVTISVRPGCCWSATTLAPSGHCLCRSSVSMSHRLAVAIVVAVHFGYRLCRLCPAVVPLSSNCVSGLSVCVVACSAHLTHPTVSCVFLVTFV